MYKRNIFAAIFFLPLLPLVSVGKFKTGSQIISLIKNNCVSANSRQCETVCKVLKGKNYMGCLYTVSHHAESYFKTV